MANGILLRSLYVVFAVVICLSRPIFAEPQICARADKSFQSFLSKFAEDASFQRIRIVFPVVYRYGRLENGDLRTELWSAEKLGHLDGPLILTRAQRQQRNVVQEVSLTTKTYVEVFHYKRDADSYEIVYAFRRVDGCWFLESLHNTSL